MIVSGVLLLVCMASSADPPGGILFPKESESREVMSLDGLWNFRIATKSQRDLGYKEEWFKKDLQQTGDDVILMPVPASYNDLTEDPKIRDHVGLVWYDRTFFVPASWGENKKRVWLRFSSVSYTAQVWVNGELVMTHEIGHLPFQQEITALLNYGSVNRISVACDNILGPDTVPQGRIYELNSEFGKQLLQSYSFDFFNYAGIHRPVVLYTTPQIFIDDITVNTEIDGDSGIIKYKIVYGSTVPNGSVDCIVELFDQEEQMVAQKSCEEDTLVVPMARFWWPYLMNPEPGYLYTLKVTLRPSSNDRDVYRLPVGIRTIHWTNKSLLINNRSVYLHGFGRHEDSDIRGKGLDMALIMKDYNLIKWIGANAYRTSHYPYAEETMDLADRMGIMIIDESPSVDTEGFSPLLLQKHKDSLAQLIKRDKNRPSVIMWSLANEPRTQSKESGLYFREVAQHAKQLDPSRPLTIALSRGYSEDKAGQYLDIISFNRYNSWYSNTGRLDMIVDNVVGEAENWYKKYNKPVLMSEYGADTVEGLHILPAYVWSEEFQMEMMSKHFQAFDELRDRDFFIGEFIWNFADFKTAQTTTRVGGNKKGIFTRARQPKGSAFHLRRRYFSLANQLNNCPLPDDLYPYTVASSTANDSRREYSFNNEFY